jgi:uncharacterized protein
MFGLPTAAALAASVLSTSFISGIFGMAGGMILLGILLAVLPLAAAMVLHGVTQMASNGWRAWLWRVAIEWRIVACYALGAIVAALMFAAVQVVPSKPVALVTLGLMSLSGLFVPAWLAPNITRQADAIGCGALCTALQLFAGVSGPIFDVFFIRSELDRKQIIATKAAIQVLAHSMKAAFFAQLLAQTGGEIAVATLLLAVGFALIGTQLSRRVLDRISDVQFRRWTRSLIAIVATICLLQGMVVLVQDRI